MKRQVRVRSLVMRVVASRGFVAMRRARARIRRALKGEAAAVHYFHQVDDPYSHLAVQKLPALQAAYSIPVVSHLVGPAGADFKGDASRYGDWAARDAASIATYHRVDFPQRPVTPVAAQVDQANRLLAAKLTDADFADIAARVGSRLWRGESLDDEWQQQEAASIMRDGETLRARLGHYFGGMFYFDGEWYWGVDRLHLLEQRLRQEGYGLPAMPVVAPLPQIDTGAPVDASGCTLEYFPSLRSPYTAIGHHRVLDLVARTGVNLVLRPVIPMMMRGIPAPRQKRLYIMTDAAREARYYGVPFGRFVDPLGEPVRQAFAWYPLAQSQGKGTAFVTAYLSAAFARGVDISSPEGLASVLDEAGIDWRGHEDLTEKNDWEGALQENLDAMLAAGLWGVPSFRVSDDSGAPAFACWGQDRIWRVEAEIRQRALRPR